MAGDESSDPIRIVYWVLIVAAFALLIYDIVTRNEDQWIPFVVVALTVVATLLNRVVGRKAHDGAA